MGYKIVPPISTSYDMAPITMTLIFMVEPLMDDLIAISHKVLNM
jgi:hypothetical protein